MKKKIEGRKFSRSLKARRALFRSLSKALIESGSITTTRQKAKAIQADIDKFINLAKKGALAQKRQLYSLFANDRKATQELFTIVKSNFGLRKGGYTRIVNLPPRLGDRAQMARLEWVEEVSKEKKKSMDKDKKSAIEKKGSKTLTKKVKGKLTKGVKVKNKFKKK